MASSKFRNGKHLRKRLGVYPYFRISENPTGGEAPARRGRGVAAENNPPPHISQHADVAASWSVPEICEAYNWPKKLAGGGVIGIIELGGGWTQSDMDAFFGGLKQPTPAITDISLDSTKNGGAQRNEADGEVVLDIQVAAASYFAATRKPATIRVYWTQDIAKGIRAAAADGCDVCSISWGADEAEWKRQDPNSPAILEEAAAEATAAGMIVFAASGDNDSSDGGPTRANVDLPASAPHVIGCGGTNKPKHGDETVWNNDSGKASGEGTGGGFSTIFTPMPPWQCGAPHGKGRMVPDVAANADPNTGYQIILYGKQEIVGGTSAVAPLYAGLFAAFGAKLGFVTPELWENSVCFNDITKGDNGAYRAAVGPDPCSGLGSPDGSRLAALLGHPHATSPRKMRELIAENDILRAQNSSFLRAGSRVALQPRAAKLSDAQARAIVYRRLGVASGTSAAVAKNISLASKGYPTPASKDGLEHELDGDFLNAGFNPFELGDLEVCSNVEDIVQMSLARNS